MLFNRTNKTATPTQTTTNTAAQHIISSTAPYISGTVVINGTRYDYSGLAFDTPSDMGIRKGRISKLTIRNRNKIVFNYDRGYDVRAAGDTKLVVSTITRYYK